MKNGKILHVLAFAAVSLCGPAAAQSVSEIATNDELGPRGIICIDHQRFCRELEGVWNLIEESRSLPSPIQESLVRLESQAEELCAHDAQRCEQLRALRTGSGVTPASADFRAPTVAPKTQLMSSGPRATVARLPEQPEGRGGLR